MLNWISLVCGVKWPKLIGKQTLEEEASSQKKDVQSTATQWGRQALLTRES
jgi:hypothetical protein